MIDPLESWETLNRMVMRISSEEKLMLLLNREVARSVPRKQYLNRIYCRFSRVRRDRETRELGLPGRG